MGLFERIENNYFEEIERYEREIGDLVKFRFQTIEEIGLEAELRVQAELDTLNDSEYRIINDILIPSYTGKTTQIDSIVISKYGIFVIETKRYRGTIVGDEDSKYWTSYYKKTKYKKDSKPHKIISKNIYNPIRQNRGHIISLEKLLSRFKNIKFYSIIAFDETASLKVNTTTKIVYIKELVGQIEELIQDETEKYSLKDVEEIYYEILKSELDDYNFTNEHREYLEVLKKDENIKTKKNIDLDFLMALSIIPGIGLRTIELIEVVYNNLDCNMDSLDDLVRVLDECYRINKFISVPNKEILGLHYKRALNLINDYNCQGVELTPYYSLNYPICLTDNKSYPLFVFSLGDMEVLKKNKKLGIFVSNSPTKYGSFCANRLGEICAKNDITIVSILDNDYDISAIKGTLDYGGQIVLVVPRRLDLNKKDEHQEIYNRVVSNKGCVISFTNDNEIKSEYYILEFNKYFAKLINKFFLVEPYLNYYIQKNIKEIYYKDLELAYIPQSKSNEELGNIDYDDILMSTYNATKLSNSIVLEKFLS